MDKIEYLASFELFDKIIHSLVSQLKSNQEDGKLDECERIEDKIAELLKHYTWLLLIGKNRWADEILKDYVNKQCGYFVEIFALSTNPAVLF